MLSTANQQKLLGVTKTASAATALQKQLVWVPEDPIWLPFWSREEKMAHASRTWWSSAIRATGQILLGTRHNVTENDSTSLPLRQHCPKKKWNVSTIYHFQFPSSHIFFKWKETGGINFNNAGLGSCRNGWTFFFQLNWLKMNKNKKIRIDV